MGFLDSLLGRTKGIAPKVDSLFSMATAYITLNTEFSLRSTGKAGICFMPVESGDFAQCENEIVELLKISETAFEVKQDEFGYAWVVVTDAQFENLVSDIYAVSSTLIDGGYGEQVLCAVFPFLNQKSAFWIYSYKRGNFYPFVPVEPTQRKRDYAYEFRLRSVLQRELPIEQELERWYPLWDMPL
ncbi:MAG: PspA-associated protein PspAB [Halobacteriota archaeon]